MRMDAQVPFAAPSGPIRRGMKPSSQAGTQPLTRFDGCCRLAVRAPGLHVSPPGIIPEARLELVLLRLPEDSAGHGGL